jgi:DNA-binding CsgD family transcriptional regulator
MTHDYKRHGTTTLFAAMNVPDGTVIGRNMQRHRHQEFIRFLNAIEREVPADETVHAISTITLLTSILSCANGWRAIRDELAVVRAIQQGKSNKVITYHLNMRESTVKVHVRNIIKKLKAKNRTDVAIKALTVLILTPSVGAHLQFSAPYNLGQLNSSDKNDIQAISAC